MEDKIPYQGKSSFAVSNPEFIRMPLILLELEPCILLSPEEIKKLLADIFNAN